MPEFDELWDFGDPKSSEERFRAVATGLLPGSPRRLELETQIARAQGLQRRFEEAHRTLDAVASALGPPERSTGVPELVRVRYLLERGRVFRSSGNPDRARPLFVESFERASRQGEEALAVDAAHMVALVEPPESQREWNERALAMSQASADPAARRWRASLLNNMGWARHGEGDFDSALTLFEQALEARLEEGDPGRTRIARWTVARCQRSLGRFEEALAAQRDSARDLEERRENDGFVDEEMAECLLALGREAEAKKHFARAAELLGADPAFAAAEPERLARLRRLAHGRE